MFPLQLDTGTTFLVRPLGPADRTVLAEAFERLSASSRTRRFLGPKPKLTARELTYLTDIDHVAHEALAAFDGHGEIVAVARYAAWPSTSSETADVAVVVADPWQGRRVGSALTARIIERAQENGFCRLTASTLADNFPARRLLARLGFRPAGTADGVASYRLELPPTRACVA